MTVQARNVFPELLLARMIFSIGGAATTTMVTAILPSMTAASLLSDRGRDSPSADSLLTPPSVSSDATITPERLGLDNSKPALGKGKSTGNHTPTRMAGFVGAFAGCGALVALGCFLPLPALLQKHSIRAGNGLMNAYYIVGAIALLVATLCFWGLRGLMGEERKSAKAVWKHIKSKKDRITPPPMGYWRLLSESLRLAYQYPEIGLAYLGGFVARSSSVANSLFIPLLVHNYFITAGFCETGDGSDVRTQCKEAYFLAAKLTGVSQLVALICAPIFGFANRSRKHHIPLCCAAISGIIGYCALSTVKVPDPSKEGGTFLIFLIAPLLGISQIGAIVCSLGLLAQCISESEESRGAMIHGENDAVPESSTTIEREDQHRSNEASPLIGSKLSQTGTLTDLKGSLAGTYSLSGGVGILILTKLGGMLFDSLSPASPFIMLALFNTLLLCGIFLCVGTQLKENR